MPRRNFWLQGYVLEGWDGSKERPIKATGPNGQGGEMRLEVLMKEEGAVSDTRLIVQCREHNGKLTVTASFSGKPECIEFSTDRD